MRTMLLAGLLSLASCAPVESTDAAVADVPDVGVDSGRGCETNSNCDGGVCDLATRACVGCVRDYDCEPWMRCTAQQVCIVGERDAGE